VHAFHYFGGVPQTILTDHMKTVVLHRRGGVIQWNPRFPDFATYYGSCRRGAGRIGRRPKARSSPPSAFSKGTSGQASASASLPDLNQQARSWLEEVTGRMHGTTRAIPRQRWPEEKLRPLDSQPDYDTSSHRRNHLCEAVVPCTRVIDPDPRPLRICCSILLFGVCAHELDIFAGRPRPRIPIFV
jgi:hypothetical protein